VTIDTIPSVLSSQFTKVQERVDRTLECKVNVHLFKITPQRDTRETQVLLILNLKITPFL
jgi:hypothetical protein